MRLSILDTQRLKSMLLLTEQEFLGQLGQRWGICLFFLFAFSSFFYLFSFLLSFSFFLSFFFFLPLSNSLVVVCLNVFDDTYAAGFMLNGFTIPIVFTMLCEATLLGGSYFFAPPLEEAEDFVGLYRSTESQKVDFNLNFCALSRSFFSPSTYFPRIINKLWH